MKPIVINQFSEDSIKSLNVAKKSKALSKKEIINDAIENNKSLEIIYKNSYGNTSKRTIKPLSINGDMFKAYCHLRKENRMFRVSRIKAIK